MATYVYKCTNKECKEFNKEKTIQMSMSEYSEDKLPKCDGCSNATSRVYTANAHQTFGDGYKS